MIEKWTDVYNLFIMVKDGLFEQDYALKKVFIDLVEKDGLRSLSVVELVKKASISRSTFYSHYSGIYGVFESIASEIASRLCEIYDKFEFREYKKALIEICYFVKNNQRVFKILLTKTGSEFSYVMINLFKKKINLNELINQMNTGDSFSSYFLTFIINGSLGVFTEWIVRGCQDDPQFIIDTFIATIKATI